MIGKINAFKGLVLKENKVVTPLLNSHKQNEQENQNNLKQLNGEFLKSYLIPFKGAKTEESYKNTRLREVEDSMTPKAEEVYNEAKKLAKCLKHKEVQQIHALKVINDMMLDAITGMDKGNLDIINPNTFRSPGVLKERFGKDIFEDAEKREKLKTVLKKESIILEKKLKKMPKSKAAVVNPVLAKDFVNDIYNAYKIDNNPNDADIEPSGTGAVDDDYLLSRVLWSSNENVNKEISQPYMNLLSAELMRYDSNKKVPLKFFEDRSRKIWKNLAVGTNMFVLYEKGINKEYMIDTFESVLKDKKGTFGKFNADNTEINRYEENINADFLIEEIKRGINEKDKNHIYVFEYDSIVENDSEKTFCDAGKYIKELPKYPNLKFVILCDKDFYYDKIADKSEIYKDFSQVAIPIINQEQAKKMFHEEKALTEDFKKDFSPKAIDKIVEVSDVLDGYYPNKAQRVMKLISNYYGDKEEIKNPDVINYINEAKEIFKTSDKDQTSVKVLLNTGLRLKDIVGLQTTKKEAASIIRQIKDHSVGTKGYIIYSQDGMPGSGRNYTARAIAGEAKIPFLEINAVDFGTKEVDIFGDSSTSPEVAMKKLFSMAKTQAETNPQKALILYIQNFEYFSCGDQVSEYHEKAMSQLLKEMDSAQKQGLNIVVMGSVNNPNMIGESTMKSFKFVDKIEVESTGTNKKARKEIIDYYLDKKKIKIDAKSEKERQDLLNSFSELTEYMSMIEIMTLLDKVKNVSKERGHKSTDKGDFIEAYLQIACGRPGMENLPDFSKKMVTSHECGHAVTQTVMNEICKSMNPWLEPSHVSFITLDPRSNFGGAVFPANPDHFEYPFERVFSNIVCDFGGYSCEKAFYGMDGSYGITSDMEMATDMATKAVVTMGMGYNFGKKSLGGAMFADSEDKSLINKDINTILRNAQTTSNFIVEEYADFIKKFTKKYSSKVGTGECIISGETFRKELNNWRKNLPKEKKEDLIALNEIIKGIIKDTQKGIVYNPQ